MYNNKIKFFKILLIKKNPKIKRNINQQKLDNYIKKKII